MFMEVKQMDKKTEGICKEGVDALVDIYTIILEDMGYTRRKRDSTRR